MDPIQFHQLEKEVIQFFGADVFHAHLVGVLARNYTTPKSECTISTVFNLHELMLAIQKDEQNPS
jgi:hypothetical protein